MRNPTVEQNAKKNHTHNTSKYVCIHTSRLEFIVRFISSTFIQEYVLFRKCFGDLASRILWLTNDKCVSRHHQLNLSTVNQPSFTIFIVSFSTYYKQSPCIQTIICVSCDKSVCVIAILNNSPKKNVNAKHIAHQLLMQSQQK